MPETIAEASRTAMGFTPFLFHAPDDSHDLLNRFTARRAIVLKVFKSCVQGGSCYLLLATDKIPDDVAGCGEDFLLFASFEPSQLAGSKRDVQRLRHERNIAHRTKVGNIRHEQRPTQPFGPDPDGWRCGLF